MTDITKACEAVIDVWLGVAFDGCCRLGMTGQMGGQRQRKEREDKESEPMSEGRHSESCETAK